jgi:hypothetical protein
MKTEEKANSAEYLILSAEQAQATPLKRLMKTANGKGYVWLRA